MAEEAKTQQNKMNKSGGLKRIITIVVLLLAIGGAGFGGMILGKKQSAKTSALKAKDPASEVVEDASKGKAVEGKETSGKEEEKGAATGSEKEGEKLDASLTYDLDKLTANLADPSGRRYVQISLQLQAASAQALKEIEENKAPLTDATLSLLATKMREDLQPPAARERLKRELITRFERVLSPKSVANIYITQMVFQ